MNISFPAKTWNANNELRSCRWRHRVNQSIGKRKVSVVIEVDFTEIKIPIVGDGFNGYDFNTITYATILQSLSCDLFAFGKNRATTSNLCFGLHNNHLSLPEGSQNVLV